MNVLIIEDEPHARRYLQRCLERHADVSVIGSCSDGTSAIDAIAKQKPDAVFLDIRIPDPDGFEVLQSIPNDSLPLVVFVTAYNDFAVKAFDVNAVDYIVKPFEESRVDRSLERIRTIRASGSIASELKRISAVLKEQRSPAKPEMLTVKNRGTIILISHAEIEYLEADGDYVRIAAKKTHTAHMTLQQALDQLPPYFLRIHRSAAVNSMLIKELRSRLRGDYAVLMQSGKSLRMSRTYRDSVRTALDRR